MKPFRERNPIPMGIIGLVVIAALVALALNINKIPFVNGGKEYKAAFSEAAGLTSGNEVRVAGVSVGKVKSVDIVGDHVEATFTVDSGIHLGDRTRASIRIKTLLGQKLLAVVPSGHGSLGPDGIPLSRTTAPYDVPQAFGDLSEEIGQIDTAQLAQAFNTMADTFANSGPSVHDALTGLSRLSQTIASRDEQLQSLLQHAQGVTGVLASRDEQVTKLINDGNTLLAAVHQRRDAIHALLVNTATLSQQLVGLVQDNQAQIGPALDNLRSVVDILQRNQDNLDKTLQLLAPFLREFSDTLGNGHWFDTVVQNLGTAVISSACPVPPVLAQICTLGSGG